uniref:Uncharacterized protein n=1 Tax=Mesocestoides corti TaxID=53468 RepID=A0A5K3EJ58_MESCO
MHERSAIFPVFADLHPSPTCRTTVNPVETRMDEIRLDVIPVVEPCRKSPGQHKVRLRSASTKQNKPRACPPV